MRHKKSAYEGLNFPCVQCDYKATRKDSFLRHTKSVHEGLKFSCDQCDYKARDKSEMVIFHYVLRVFLDLIFI